MSRILIIEDEPAMRTVLTDLLVSEGHRVITASQGAEGLDRALAEQPDLILLDEPFNAVDSKTTASLLELIARWHQQQRTVIAVLHDDAQVRQHFPQTLLLAREMVAWGPTPLVLTEANLARSRTMAQAWDEDAALCERSA
jgi:zinc/manganese transport system ATP-binding protein